MNCKWCNKPMKEGGNEGFCWPMYSDCKRDFDKDLGDQSEWAGAWSVEK